MLSKPIAFALLAFGCVTAAGVGGYLATRQAQAPAVLEAGSAASATSPAPALQEGAVLESEGIVELAAPDAASTLTAEAPLPPAPAPRAAPARVERPEPARRPAASARRAAAPPPAPAPAPRRAPEPVVEPEPAPQFSPATVTPPIMAPMPSPLPREPEPVFTELVVGADSVIGLQIENTVTTETASVEDRVDARVTRDVRVGGDIAIPAGSRVEGSVSFVDKGGKVKERARLGVRFHTLVLADGTTLPIRTETIYRDGESPAGESTAKIGGAAVGGAILGAIFGGAKGAVIGGSAGAAGGTAATLAGGRNPATLAAGSTVTVRLSEPVTVTVEK